MLHQGWGCGGGGGGGMWWSWFSSRGRLPLGVNPRSALACGVGGRAPAAQTRGHDASPPAESLIEECTRTLVRSRTRRRVLYYSRLSNQATPFRARLLMKSCQQLKRFPQAAFPGRRRRQRWMESDYGRNYSNCLRGWQSDDSVRWGRRRLLEIRAWFTSSDGFIYLFIYCNDLCLCWFVEQIFNQHNSFLWSRESRCWWHSRGWRITDHGGAIRPRSRLSQEA